MAFPKKIWIVESPVLANMLALFAGSIFHLALAPTNLWPLGLLSVFILLVISNQAGAKQIALRHYLFAIAMYGWGISWIYVSVHEYGEAIPILAGGLVALLVGVLSLPMLLQGFLLHRFFRFHVLALSLGLVLLWVIREWIFTWFLTGFPWLLVGYGHLETPLGAFAPYVGVLGVGFLVLLSVALVHYFLSEMRLQYRVLALIFLLLIWGAGFILPHYKLVQERGESISVSLVQGNIDQHQKWRREMVRPIIQQYLDLTEPEWGRDLIVWPEAAITVFKESAQNLLSEIDDKGKAQKSALILGIPDRDESGNVYNAAIALGQGEGSYFKRLLVPFGEYVPFERQLRGLIKAFDLPMSRNQTGPAAQDLLRVGDVKVLMSICYEIIYPNLIRSEETADLLITISDDTWFGESIGPLQHMQMAQMRALENGRYLLRGTNSGVSAIVNPKGQIQAQFPQFQKGVLRGEVWAMEGTTPFNRFGHVPILSLIALLFLSLMVWRSRYTH
ncbi:MAG: apolipoprotein N-acyltransferase [Pseudomonadales bacterium]|nr:apolipoprotein N-acyltransferase [Pseudomonadales bacterium]